MSLFSRETIWRRRLLAEAAAASSSGTDGEGGKNHEGDDPTAILWFIFIALAIGTACRSAFTFVNSPVPYTVALLVSRKIYARRSDDANHFGFTSNFKDAFSHHQKYLHVSLLAFFSHLFLLLKNRSLEYAWAY